MPRKLSAQPEPQKVKMEAKNFVKVGRPDYKVTKQRDTEMVQQSLLFQANYPVVAEGTVPHQHFISALNRRLSPQTAAVLAHGC